MLGTEALGSEITTVCNRVHGNPGWSLDKVKWPGRVQKSISVVDHFSLLEMLASHNALRLICCNSILTCDLALGRESCSCLHAPAQLGMMGNRWKHGFSFCFLCFGLVFLYIRIYNCSTIKWLLGVVWFFFIKKPQNQKKLYIIYIFVNCLEQSCLSILILKSHIEVFITASWKFTFSWNLANVFWLEASFLLKKFTIRCLRIFFPFLFFFSKSNTFWNWVEQQ